MGSGGRQARPAEGDPRWARIVARDEDADGEFWYSVVTTGVYCRPSCPSRCCDPANATLHDTLESARATGFRPCRRCRPEEPSLAVRRAAIVARACRLLEDAAPSLNEIAAALALSPAHLHRIFKALTGLTPRAYAAACRARRAADALAASGSVTEAIYEAGYSSSGRFYETAAARLGMTPTSVRRGGAGEEIRFAIGETTLGSVLVASSATGVVAILLGDDPETLARDLRDRFRHATLIGADAAYASIVEQAIGLVEEPGRGSALPLDIRGTAFQQRVWSALRALPPGETLSYAELAARLGAPQATRAVAGACAANKLAIAIPCHRVVRSDGGLSGYAWGVERKRMILDRERGR